MEPHKPKDIIPTKLSTYMMTENAATAVVPPYFRVCLELTT